MKGIRLIRANSRSEEFVNGFLQSNQELKMEDILQIGYLVEINDQIRGCFILDEIEEGLYWLKKLYVTKTATIKIPILVEAILVLAKQKNAKKVYVNSHKLMMDIILESLNFHPQENNELLNKYDKGVGKWWEYSVSE